MPEMSCPPAQSREDPPEGETAQERHKVQRIKRAYLAQMSPQLKLGNELAKRKHLCLPQFLGPGAHSSGGIVWKLCVIFPPVIQVAGDAGVVRSEHLKLPVFTIDPVVPRWGSCFSNCVLSPPTLRSLPLPDFSPLSCVCNNSAICGVPMPCPLREPL